MTQTNYDILKEYEEHQEPIPSYRELQQLKKFCEEFNALNVSKENQRLKELLKECKPYIALYTENNKHIGFTPETANLLQRIKEVLK